MTKYMMSTQPSSVMTWWRQEGKMNLSRLSYNTKRTQSVSLGWVISDTP